MKKLKTSKNPASRAAVFAVLAVVFGWVSTPRADVPPVNAAGALLSNRVVLTAANVSVRVTNTTIPVVTVATMLGGSIAITDDQNASPGASAVWITNHILVTNYGNITHDIVLKFDLGGTNVIPGAAWSNGRFENNVSMYTIRNIPKGISSNISFKVGVPVGAPNGKYRTYLIYATNQFAGASAIRSNYTGDDALTYGGALGDNFVNAATGLGRIAPHLQVANFGGGTNALTANDASRSNRVWQITVAAPVLTVFKRAETNEFLTGNGPDGRALPGATITWKIFVTNSGNASGTSVSIWDLIQTNFTAFVAGSLRTNNALTAGPPSVRFATAGAVSDADDTDAGAYGAATFASGAGQYVEFEPRADATLGPGTSAGVVGTGANAAFAGWYRTRIR